MSEPHRGQPHDSNRSPDLPQPTSLDRPSSQTSKLRRLSIGVTLGIITVVVIEALLVVFTQPLSQIPTLYSGSAIAQTTPATPNLAPLQSLLDSGDWPAANEETHRLLITVGDRNASGWLEDEEVVLFPCETLGAIDEQWVNASEGRFGFSVQQSLYVQFGGTVGDYQRGAYGLLGQTAAWFRSATDWEAATIPYTELAFQQPGFAPATAPIGHLPIGHNAPNGTQTPGQPRQGGGLRGGVLLRTLCDLTAENPMAAAPMLIPSTPNDSSTQSKAASSPTHSSTPVEPFSQIGNVLLGLFGALALGALACLGVARIAILVTVFWKRRDRSSTATSPQNSPIETSPAAPRLEPDPKAIAQLLNARLQPKGMRAKVVRRNQQMVIGIWAKSPVSRSLATHLKNFLGQQDVCRGEVIRVMGYVAGQKAPVWREKVAIWATPRQANAPPVASSHATSSASQVEAPQPSATKAPPTRLPLGVEWFLVNGLALLITIVLGSVLFSAGNVLLFSGNTPISSSYFGIGSWVSSTAVFLGVGAIASLCFGVGQRWVLGRRLPQLKAWIPATVGGMLATILLVQISLAIPFSSGWRLLCFAIFLAFTPLLQFRILRTQTPRAVGWLIGHCVALPISLAVASGIGFFWFSLNAYIDNIGPFVMAMLGSLGLALVLFIAAISFTVHLMMRSLPEQPTRL